MDIEKLKSYDLKDEDGEFTDEEIKRVRFRVLRFFG